MINVFAREIEFMIAVLDNDLAQENTKLRDGAQVYRLVRGANNTLIVTVGKFRYDSSFVIILLLSFD